MSKDVARSRRELTACLRTGRALRVPRARTKGRGKKFVTPEVMISERPAEADGPSRARPLGRRPHHRSQQVGDRHSCRAHDPLHHAACACPRWTDTARNHRVKNGPPLAGHGAEAVRDAIAEQIMTSARATTPIAHLGPRRRDGPARPASRRHRAGDLLLRPAQPPIIRPMVSATTQAAHVNCLSFLFNIHPPFGRQ